jgi:hypothetical protein
MNGLLLALCTVASALAGYCTPTADTYCTYTKKYICDDSGGCYCPGVESLEPRGCAPITADWEEFCLAPKDEVFHPDGQTWREHNKHAELHIFQLQHALSWSEYLRFIGR